MHMDKFLFICLFLFSPMYSNNLISAQEPDALYGLLSESELSEIRRQCDVHISAAVRAMGYAEKTSLPLSVKIENITSHYNFTTSVRGDIISTELVKYNCLGNFVFDRPTSTVVEINYKTDYLHALLTGTIYSPKNNKYGNDEYPLPAPFEPDMHSGYIDQDMIQDKAVHSMIQDKAVHFGIDVDLNSNDGWVMRGIDIMGKSGNYGYSYGWARFNDHGAKYKNGHAFVDLNFKGWPKHFQRGIRQNQINDLPEINPKEAIEIAEKAISPFVTWCHYPGKVELIIADHHPYYNSSWCLSNPIRTNTLQENKLYYIVYFHKCTWKNINYFHTVMQIIEHHSCPKQHLA